MLLQKTSKRRPIAPPLTKGARILGDIAKTTELSRAEIGRLQMTLLDNIVESGFSRGSRGSVAKSAFTELYTQ